MRRTPDNDLREGYVDWDLIKQEVEAEEAEARDKADLDA